MKKAVFLLILILGIVSGVFTQSSGGPMDLIVVLDTSASMSSSYQKTSDYLIGPFLKNFLRIGDTFHLISFAGTPKVEISRRVEGAGEVEAVIGRLLLMYPLDPASDVSGALNYASQYASSLSGGRPKKVILITDGDAADTQSLADSAAVSLKSQGIDFQYIKVPVTGNGPSSGRASSPPSSIPSPAAAAQTKPPAQTSTVTPAPQPARPAQTQTSPAAQTAQPAQAAQPGQTTQPVQTAPVVPPVQAPSSAPSQGASPAVPVQPSLSGQTQVQPQVSQGSNEQPSATSQPQAGTVPALTPQAGGEAAVPGTVPPYDATVSAAAPDAGTPQADTGEPAASTPPQAETQAPAQVQPYSPPQSVQQSAGGPAQPSGESASIPGDSHLPLIIGLIILGLLLLGLIIFFAARRLQNSPNRAMAQAAVPPPKENRDRVEAQRQEQIKGAEMMGSYAEAQRFKPKPMPKDKVYTEVPRPEMEGPLMLNLFVEDQNTAIGRRNIHTVKSGYSFSVGGGKSDFLIFLVPIPPHIAEVQFDGSNCTFYPRKPQYFPDIGSQSVPNCIGKTIRVISDKRYELHIRIDRYEDPLKALNKMLHSIAVPGK